MDAKSRELHNPDNKNSGASGKPSSIYLKIARETSLWVTSILPFSIIIFFAFHTGFVDNPDNGPILFIALLLMSWTLMGLVLQIAKPQINALNVAAKLQEAQFKNWDYLHKLSRFASSVTNMINSGDGEVLADAVDDIENTGTPLTFTAKTGMEELRQALETEPDSKIIVKRVPKPKRKPGRPESAISPKEDEGFDDIAGFEEIILIAIEKYPTLNAYCEAENRVYSTYSDRIRKLELRTGKKFRFARNKN